MKKTIFMLLLSAATLTTFVGCNNGNDEPSVPDSFPRKQLIEHFTGQTCGYCPYGMDLITEAIQGSESQYVWLSNHAGYADDNYTIKESKQLVSKFGVNGAPNIMFNRKVREYEDENGDTQKGKVFHPYYLADYTSAEPKTTTASVEIENSYDASTKTLTVTVSGQAVDTYALLSLTIAVKESGLHGEQADYLNTWEGWEDYVHTNVVRAYLTNYDGDPVGLQANKYTATYTLQLDNEWKADNCSVVAFLTDDNTGEVVNAEEAPIVSGTKGGSDQEHKGITKVEVPDTYPEYNAVPDGAANLTFDQAGYAYAGQFSNGNNVVALQLMSNKIFTLQSYTLVPVAIIYLVTDGDGSTLPTGTFQFSESGEKGTAWAGFRDDKNYQLNGSSFYLAITSYLQQGYLLGLQWMMNKGSITVSDNSVSYDVTTLIGSNIKGSFSGTLQNLNGSAAPRQMKPMKLNEQKALRCPKL